MEVYSFACEETDHCISNGQGGCTQYTYAAWQTVDAYFWTRFLKHSLFNVSERLQALPKDWMKWRIYVNNNSEWMQNVLRIQLLTKIALVRWSFLLMTSKTWLCIFFFFIFISSVSFSSVCSLILLYKKDTMDSFNQCSKIYKRRASDPFWHY